MCNCNLRTIACTNCDGEGRITRFTGEFCRETGAAIERDYGKCPVCNGTGMEEIEVEPITLEDLDQ